MSREVLHLSLGAAACNVTAHLLNLEGLAATTSDQHDNNDDNAAAICNAGITHAVSAANQVYCPRVLMTDEPSTFRRSSRGIAATAAATATSAYDMPTWNNTAVERLDHRPGSEPQQQQQQQQQQQLATFMETASTLAYGSYSRYRAPAAAAQTHTITYNVSDSNDRHVQWDEEEEEQDDELDEQERDETARRQREQWRQRQAPLQHQLDDFWSSLNGNQERPLPAGTPSPMEETPTAPTNGPAPPPSPTPPANALTWMDFWMPPYHPRSCLPLPVHRDSDLVHHWDAYTAGTGTNSIPIVSDWTKDCLLESLRFMLEDCDSCQGVTIASAGHGLYAGLTTILLQELQEECPSAARWVWSIQDKDDSNEPLSAATDTAESATSSWHSSHVRRLRQQVETALAWHDHVELASSVLPLQLPDSNGSVLKPAAFAAVALESVTLPYRLSGRSKKSQLGLNSYYYGSFGGDLPFGTAPNMGFGEFLSSLQPSVRHNILELDTVLPDKLQDSRQLWSRLQEGTSVERDHRMRDRRVNVRNVPPGAWMMDQGTNDGLLTSFSPHTNGKATDRSVHHHYGLSSSLRQNIGPSATSSQYLLCLMQGMGIRYRPESSIATVVNQNLSTLTGDGYAAGSYWHSVWGSSAPALSVLGNSTRAYSHLHQISADIKQAMLPRYRGYYNRDVMNGILPEAEDCQEALAFSLDVRDLYQPPEGSGLVQNEEGIYFDES